MVAKLLFCQDLVDAIGLNINNSSYDSRVFTWPKTGALGDCRRKSASKALRIRSARSMTPWHLALL
jgi:hypothetical protein